MKIKLLRNKRYKFGFYLAKGEVRDAVWNEDANCFQTKTSEGVRLSVPKKDAQVIHTAMKNKYVVYIKEVHVVPVEVEAESTADARAKVANMLSNDDGGIDFGSLCYSHTEEPETWHVDANVPNK